MAAMTDLYQMIMLSVFYETKKRAFAQIVTTVFGVLCNIFGL